MVERWQGRSVSGCRVEFMDVRIGRAPPKQGICLSLFAIPERVFVAHIFAFVREWSCHACGSPAVSPHHEPAPNEPSWLSLAQDASSVAALFHDSLTHAQSLAARFASRLARSCHPGGPSKSGCCEASRTRSETGATATGITDRAGLGNGRKAGRASANDAGTGDGVRATDFGAAAR